MLPPPTTLHILMEIRNVVGGKHAQKAARASLRLIAVLVVGRNEHSHSIFKQKAFGTRRTFELSFQHRNKLIAVVHMGAKCEIFVRLSVYIMFFNRAFGFKKHDSSPLNEFLGIEFIRSANPCE